MLKVEKKKMNSNLHLETTSKLKHSSEVSSKHIHNIIKLPLKPLPQQNVYKYAAIMINATTFATFLSIKKIYAKHIMLVI